MSPEQALRKLLTHYESVNRLFMTQFESTGHWSEAASENRRFETQLRLALAGEEPLLDDIDEPTLEERAEEERLGVKLIRKAEPTRLADVVLAYEPGSAVKIWGDVDAVVERVLIEAGLVSYGVRHWNGRSLESVSVPDYMVEPRSKKGPLNFVAPSA